MRLEKYSSDGVSVDLLARMVGIDSSWFEKMVEVGILKKKRMCKGIDPLDFVNALDRYGIALLRVFDPGGVNWMRINGLYRELILDVRRDILPKVISSFSFSSLLNEEERWWGIKKVGLPMYDLVPIDPLSGQWYSRNVVGWWANKYLPKERRKFVINSITQS